MGSSTEMSSHGCSLGTGSSQSRPRAKQDAGESRSVEEGKQQINFQGSLFKSQSFVVERAPVTGDCSRIVATDPQTERLLVVFKLFEPIGYVLAITQFRDEISAAGEDCKGQQQKHDRAYDENAHVNLLSMHLGKLVGLSQTRPWAPLVLLRRSRL